METSGLKLSFALLLLSMGGTVTSTPAYQWTDQDTGEEVTCQQCPQGTFVAKHCTSTSNTECQPCPDQHYTSYWNYVEKCRFCNIICEDREQVKHECNATQNRVCECKLGYRRESHDCVRDCSKFMNIEDPECDPEVTEFVVRQNLSLHSIRQLERVLNSRISNVKRKITSKRIRSLLRQIKNAHPDQALLPQLMKLVKEANMTHLEKKLNNTFINHEEVGNMLPSVQ